MRVDRRVFLAGMAAGLVASARAPARSRRPRLPLAFSTLGCPAWSWPTILDQAERLGYAAIELRGVAGEMDLTRVPELSGSRQAGTRAEIASRGLVVSDLGASAYMHAKDPTQRAAQLDEGRRFIDLAHALGVKYVRMFGNEVPPGETRAEVMARVVDGFREMAAYAQAAGVVVLVESHGDFVHSSDLREILAGVGSESFALLWDAHHTFVAGKEPPAETAAALGRWVRHVHLKDSRPEGAERRYVLTGTGEVPVRAQVETLVRMGYGGYYCFEWEKKWHPEIEEPEVAFPHFAKVVGGWLAAAGVKPA